MATRRVAGVILAAGASTRLGRPKQLLPLAGRPVLAHVVVAASQTGLDPLIVILGYAADDIRRQADLFGTTVLVNPRYADGQSSSVRAAIRALPADVGGVVFLLGDQPLVEPEIIKRLLAANRKDTALIIQPRYAEGPGNPVLIGRPLFPALLELTGDTGARPLLRRHADRIRFVDARDFRRPDDVDTWDDYERLRGRFALEKTRSGS
jgi:molybdenum cofactor cytidylyltransferase